jgi:hypothetical protein
VLWSEGFLRDRKRALVERFGLGVPALVAVKARQVVKAGRVVGVLLPEVPSSKQTTAPMTTAVKRSISLGAKAAKVPRKTKITAAVATEDDDAVRHDLLLGDIKDHRIRNNPPKPERPGLARTKSRPSLRVSPRLA